MTALDAVKSLIQLRLIKASILKDLCKLDGALEKMGERLQQLLTEGDEGEYAMDLEVFRRQVKEIYLRKLDDNKHVKKMEGQQVVVWEAHKAPFKQLLNCRLVNLLQDIQMTQQEEIKSACDYREVRLHPQNIQ